MSKKIWASYKGLYKSLDNFRIKLKKAIKKEANNLEGCEWAYDVIKPSGKILYMNVLVENKSLDKLFDKYSKKYTINLIHKFKWGRYWGYWEAGRLVINKYRHLTTQKSPWIRGMFPEKPSLERIMNLLEKRGVVRKLR